MALCIRESIPSVKKKEKYTRVARCFDGDCSCPLVFEADDNLQHLYLQNAILLIVARRFVGYRKTLSRDRSDVRPAIFPPSKPNGHCLSLEMWFHSCGVTNYTFGLKWQTYCLVFTWPRRALLFSSKPPNLLQLKWDIVKSPHIPEESFLTWRHKSDCVFGSLKWWRRVNWII